jgi:hypothetical protein
VESLRDFLPKVRKHLGIYVMYGSYLELCNFLVGYDEGSGDRVLKKFHEWLVARGKGRPELYWPFLVLCEIYPDGALPRIRELTEEQDEILIDKLFCLLDEFFESR